MDEDTYPSPTSSYVAAPEPEPASATPAASLALPEVDAQPAPEATLTQPGAGEADPAAGGSAAPQEGASVKDACGAQAAAEPDGADAPAPPPGADDPETASVSSEEVEAVLKVPIPPATVPVVTATPRSARPPKAAAEEREEAAMAKVTVNLAASMIQPTPPPEALSRRDSGGGGALVPAPRLDGAAGERSVPSYAEVIIVQVTEEHDTYSHGLAIAQRLIEVYPRDVQVSRCRLDQIWSGQPEVTFSRGGGGDGAGAGAALPKVQVRLIDVHATTQHVEQIMARYLKQQDEFRALVILLPPPESWGIKPADPGAAGKAAGRSEGKDKDAKDADPADGKKPAAAPPMRGWKQQKLYDVRQALHAYASYVLPVSKDIADPPVDAAVMIENLVDQKIKLLRSLHQSIDHSLVRHVSNIPPTAKLALYDAQNLAKQKSSYKGYRMGRAFKVSRRLRAARQKTDTHAYQPPKFKRTSPKDAAYTAMHKIKGTPAATGGRRPPMEVLTINKNYEQVELEEAVLDEKAEMLDKLASRCQRATSMPTGFAYERSGVLCNMTEGKDGAKDRVLFFEHYDVPYAMRKRGAKKRKGSGASEAGAVEDAAERRPLWQRTPSPDHDVPAEVKKSINLCAKNLTGFGRLEKAIVMEGRAGEGPLRHLIEHVYSGRLQDDVGTQRASKRHLDQTFPSECFWKGLPRFAPRHVGNVRYDPTAADAAAQGLAFGDASWSAMEARMHGQDAAPPAEDDPTAGDRLTGEAFQRSVMQQWVHHHRDTQQALRARLLLPLNVKENHPYLQPAPPDGGGGGAAGEDAEGALPPDRRVSINWIRDTLGGMEKEQWTVQRYCRPPVPKDRARHAPHAIAPPALDTGHRSLPVVPPHRPVPPNLLDARVHPSMKRLPQRSLQSALASAVAVAADGAPREPLPPPSPPLVPPRKRLQRFQVSKHPCPQAA
eukprot:TRINITY_DN21039_c0_g1_i1.p1 TRINITY_DN21039_c0_g1~~TRINITY_DN21039_c0_g1_i1.p1  ORF type:complete len:945 (+),score=318.96 TRINITY_DN21039_c0_g1_i1:62-2896(+)